MFASLFRNPAGNTVHIYEKTTNYFNQFESFKNIQNLTPPVTDGIVQPQHVVRKPYSEITYNCSRKGTSQLVTGTMTVRNTANFTYINFNGKVLFITNGNFNKIFYSKDVETMINNYPPENNCIVLSDYEDDDKKTHQDVMYIDYVRNLDHCGFGKDALKEMFTIVNNVGNMIGTKTYILVDKAEFKCTDYKLKADQLRILLNQKKINEISIYNKYGFVSPKVPNLKEFACFKYLDDLGKADILVASFKILREDLMHFIELHREYGINKNVKCYETPQPDYENVKFDVDTEITNNIYVDITSVENLCGKIENLAAQDMYVSGLQDTPENCAIKSDLLDLIRYSKYYYVNIETQLNGGILFNTLYKCFQIIAIASVKMETKVIKLQQLA